MSVSSVAQVFERQADDARELAGAQGSAWNGRVGWLPRTDLPHPSGVVGIADWDGSIYFDRQYVLRPLETLFATQPDDLRSDQLQRAKNALAVVLHENCHLLAADPRDHARTRDQWEWDLVVLEEGATELFTQTHLDRYTHRLGLEQRVPRLDDVRVDAAYPLFVPAVQTLTQGVGRLTAQPPLEVLRGLVRQAGGRKFETLGSMVLEGSGLAGRMPEADRPPAIAGLAKVTREVLGEVGQVGSLLTPEASVKLSRRIGREAVRGMLQVLEDLDSGYPPAPAPDTMRRVPRRPPGRGPAARGRHGVERSRDDGPALSR